MLLATRRDDTSGKGQFRTALLLVGFYLKWEVGVGKGGGECQQKSIHCSRLRKAS